VDDPFFNRPIDNGNRLVQGSLRGGLVAGLMHLLDGTAHPGAHRFVAHPGFEVGAEAFLRGFELGHYYTPFENKGQKVPKNWRLPIKKEGFLKSLKSNEIEGLAPTEKRPGTTVAQYQLTSFSPIKLGRIGGAFPRVAPKRSVHPITTRDTTSLKAEAEPATLGRMSRLHHLYQALFKT
jgi:hypothetical protein